MVGGQAAAAKTATGPATATATATESGKETATETGEVSVEVPAADRELGTVRARENAPVGGYLGYCLASDRASEAIVRAPVAGNSGFQAAAAGSAAGTALEAAATVEPVERELEGTAAAPATVVGSVELEA